MLTTRQFNELHASQCADHAARARNVKCGVAGAIDHEIDCKYELPETDGSWNEYQSQVSFDDHGFTWVKGETRCYSSAISQLK